MKLSFEIVKIKRDSIWDHYHRVKNHNNQDIHIQKWIKFILNPENLNKTKEKFSFICSSDIQKLIPDIVEGLSNPDKFEKTLDKL